MLIEISVIYRTHASHLWSSFFFFLEIANVVLWSLYTPELALSRREKLMLQGWHGEYDYARQTTRIHLWVSTCTRSIYSSILYIPRIRPRKPHVWRPTVAHGHTTAAQTNFVKVINREFRLCSTLSSGCVEEENPPSPRSEIPDYS